MIKKTTRLKEEVKILGAGVSGLTAGIILAKNNYKVKIFEKRDRIGSFFKKDVQTLRNYPYSYDIIEKYRELGIKISNFYPIFKEIRFSPSLKNIEIHSKQKPLFYNIIRGYSDRRSLDNDLLEQAKKHGVEVFFNCKVTPELKKDASIIATGAPRREVVGYGNHYKDVAIESNTLYYFLNNMDSSYAFSYAVPFTEREASVVVVSLKKKNKNHIKNEYDKLIKKNEFIKKIIKKR